MGTTNAGISNASVASKKAIREFCKSGTRESGYHLSIHIERKSGVFFFETKKKESKRLLKIYGIASSNMMTEF